MRRFGSPPEKGATARRRPGVYAILERDGKFLLTFQQQPDAEFQLPGGGIDPGESPVPALHREVMEETGWHIGPPRRIGLYRRFAFMPEYNIYAEKICAIYAARPTMEIGPPKEAGHSAHWLSGAEALSLLRGAGDRHVLSRYLRRS